MSRCKVHLASASSRRYEWLKVRLDGESVDFSAAALHSAEQQPQSGLDVRTQVQKILASKVEAAKIEIAIQEIGEVDIPDFILFTLNQSERDFRYWTLEDMILLNFE